MLCLALILAPNNLPKCPFNQPFGHKLKCYFATTCVFCEFDFHIFRPWRDNLDSVVLWKGPWYALLSKVVSASKYDPMEWFLGLIITPDQRCSTAHTAPWSSLTRPCPLCPLNCPLLCNAPNYASSCRIGGVVHSGVSWCTPRCILVNCGSLGCIMVELHTLLHFPMHSGGFLCIVKHSGGAPLHLPPAVPITPPCSRHTSPHYQCTSPTRFSKRISLPICLNLKALILLPQGGATCKNQPIWPTALSCNFYSQALQLVANKLFYRHILTIDSLHGSLSIVSIVMKASMIVARCSDEFGRIAISRKRHFRSLKRRNENTLQ